MVRVLIVNDFINFHKLRDFLDGNCEPTIELVVGFTGEMVAEPFDVSFQLVNNKEAKQTEEEKNETILNLVINLNTRVFELIKMAKPILQ